MNSKTNSKEPIFEVNKHVLKNAETWCKELDQTKEKNKISISIDFYNYSDVGNNISSLLNLVETANDEEIIKEPVLYQNIVGLANQLVKSLPLEFLDKLLVSQEYNKPEFTNIQKI